MKKELLSLFEFEKYCKEHDVKEAIFDIDNQKEELYPENLNMKLTFHNIKFCYNPDMIVFSDKDNMFVVKRVRKVVVSDSVIGKIANFLCGDELFPYLEEEFLFVLN